MLHRLVSILPTELHTLDAHLQSVYNYYRNELQDMIPIVPVNAADALVIIGLTVEVEVAGLTQLLQNLSKPQRDCWARPSLQERIIDVRNVSAGVLQIWWKLDTHQ